MEEVERKQDVPAKGFKVICKQLFLFYLLPFLAVAAMIILYTKAEDIFGFHEDITKVIRFVLLGFYVLLAFVSMRRMK